MDSSPLVSILIPNYNKASYLGETLDSVLAQTYTNWECIVVDDHSTDDSLAILEEYGERDSRFKIFRRPDNLPKGGNGARNFALTASCGDLIQYLDSDDVIDSHKVFTQIRYHLKDEEIITISNWEFFGLENCNRKLERYRLLNVPQDPLLLLATLWNQQKFFLPFCFLIPRSHIRENWKHSLVKNQDGDFFFRLLLNAKSVRFVGDSYGFYRIPSELHVSGSRSFAAFRSDFMTISSYEDILSFRSDELVVSGLVNNYVHFIVRSIDVFPVLAKIASRRVLKLDPKLKHVKLYKRYFELHKIFGFGFSYWIRLSFVRLNRLIN